MDDLVTWLRSQLDEEERLARRAAERYVVRNSDRKDHGQPYWPLPSVEATLRAAEPDIAAGLDLIKAHSPARVLAEVDAKRRVLDMVATTDFDETDDPAEWAAIRAHRTDLERVVQLLALTYADRPGYREEWRP